MLATDSFGGCVCACVWANMGARQVQGRTSAHGIGQQTACSSIIPAADTTNATRYFHPRQLDGPQGVLVGLENGLPRATCVAARHVLPHHMHCRLCLRCLACHRPGMHDKRSSAVVSSVVVCIRCRPAGTFAWV